MKIRVFTTFFFLALIVFLSSPSPAASTPEGQPAADAWKRMSLEPGDFPPYPNLVFLPIISYPEIDIPVSWVLTPFNANTSDLNGPASWNANYGKTPEIIVASDGLELDVLAQDYDASTPWSAVLLHIEPGVNGYKITQAFTNLPMLDRVMGLAVDDLGNRYYATGVDESGLVDPYYPPLNTYRSNIVRIIKLTPRGGLCSMWTWTWPATPSTTRPR